MNINNLSEKEIEQIDDNNFIVICDERNNSEQDIKEKKMNADIFITPIIGINYVNQIKNDYITNSICAIITGGTLEDVKRVVGEFKSEENWYSDYLLLPIEIAKEYGFLEIKKYLIEIYKLTYGLECLEDCARGFNPSEEKMLKHFEELEKNEE